MTRELLRKGQVKEALPNASSRDGLGRDQDRVVFFAETLTADHCLCRNEFVRTALDPR